jgi:hypothetical protein
MRLQVRPLKSHKPCGLEISRRNPSQAGLPKQSGCTLLPSYHNYFCRRCQLLMSNLPVSKSCKRSQQIKKTWWFAWWLKWPTEQNWQDNRFHSCNCMVIVITRMVNISIINIPYQWIFSYTSQLQMSAFADIIIAYHPHQLTSFFEHHVLLQYKFPFFVLLVLTVSFRLHIVQLVRTSS